jgi:hypothetical protein
MTERLTPSHRLMPAVTFTKKSGWLKMKVNILLILMGLILFLQGCAQTVKMAAVASSDQKIGYQDTITSQKKHFVSLSPYSELKKFKLAKDKTIFMLSVENGGEKPIDIGYDNISVIFEGKNAASNKISLPSVDEFMNDLKEEYSDNEYDYIEDALNDIIIKAETQTSGSSSSTTTLEEDFEDLATDIENMRKQNDLLREVLPPSILNPQTIMPGQDCTGLVVCNTKDMDEKTEGNFQVIVTVAGEEHRFAFNRGFLNSRQ